jgi:hypothetical protein
VEEPLAAQLEWRGNSSIRLTFEVLVTVEESNGELTARGVLAEQVLADPEAVEAWELLSEGSPYFRLAFDDGSVFATVVWRTGAAGRFNLSEYVLEMQS